MKQQEQEIMEQEEHKERKTEVYNISDALHELEVDLRYNAKFPNKTWRRNERTDIISIHTGFLSPTIVINKTQCKKWMREHLTDGRVSKAGKHWEKDGQLYVSIHRSRYRVWVSCGENRFRTEESRAGIQAGENARDAIFANLKDGDE